MYRYQYPVFLHFVNREMLLIKGLDLEPTAHVKLIKNCGLLSPEPLVAPYAQVAELYWGKKKLLALVSQLCGLGKLDLISGATSLYEFLESRRDLYGSRKTRYPMYFGTKPLSLSHYQVSPSLNTTSFIRKNILDALVSKTYSASNIISRDEVDRLRRHADFIQSEFHERGSAVTYSMYEIGAIAPQPEEARFLGRLSTRLFAHHYSSEHNLAVPTGVFSDRGIEDYDRFPFYDVVLNSILIEKLGLSQILSDEEFHQPYLNIIMDADFADFCAKRIILIKALRDAVRANGDSSTHTYALSALMHTLDFGSFRTSQPPTAGALSSRIVAALNRAASSNNAIAKAVEEISMVEGNVTKILVSTATDIEDEAFKATTAYFGFTKTDIISYPEFAVAEYNAKSGIRLYHLRTSAGSSGVHGSQRMAERAFEILRPAHAFAVGIAFGLDDKKQTIGDVMVAEYIMSYEQQKVEDARIRWRGNRVPCQSGIVSFARYFETNEFKIHVGGMFSGEKLVNSSQLRDLLVEMDDKCIGGDMEGAGFTTAGLARSVPFSLVKGISDFAVHKQNDRQKSAARNAFTLFFEFLNRQAQWLRS